MKSSKKPKRRLESFKKVANSEKKPTAVETGIS